MNESTLRDLPRKSAGTRARSWFAACTSLAASILVILIAYADTAGSIVSAWSSSNLYSHGFLVIPAAAYLTWRRRDALARISPAPSLVGLLALLSACFVWLLGEMTTTSVLKHLGLVLMIQAIVLTFFGWRIFWIARFPLAYLFFAVPFGAELIPPLQDATAEAVTSWLQTSGIPTHLTGHRIVTPAGAFYIAEACAGARFLISALAVGVFAADLFYRRTWRKLLLIALSLALPVVANALRAYGIIVVAVQFGRESGIMVDHITYGFLFLAIVLLGLLGLGLIFREPGSSETPMPAVPAAQSEPRSVRTSTMLLAAALSLTIAPTLLVSDVGRDDRTAAARSAALKLDPPVLWGLATEQPDWHPIVQNADLEMTRSFVSEGAEMSLYIAYFLAQRQGAEVVNERNRLAGNLSSLVYETSSHDLRIDGQRTKVPCLRVAGTTAPLWICYWYWVGGKFTGNAIMAKLYQAAGRLWGDESAAAIVAFAVPDRAPPGEARQVMQRFLQDVAPLNTALQGAISD